jgi:hypothetical protein
MELNIIDVINKSEYFLKKVFLNGIESAQLGRIDLTFQNKIEFYIYTNQEPVFSPEKWGKWGVDYTTVVLRISGHFLKNVQINNWQNNKLEDCEIKVKKDSNIINLSFFGKGWDVIVELEDLIYQESTVYIDDALVN